MTPPQLTSAAILTGAVATLGGLTYAALSAESQLFGRTLIAGRNPSEIALTYDDGPNDIITERLLDLLAENNIRASFFLIGRFVQQRPQIVRAIAAAGHLIGNHTMHHPWLAWQSASRIRHELTDCNAAIEDTIGQPIQYFRAPHGARRPAVLHIAHELNLTPVQWNIIVGDWNPISAEEIARRAEQGIAHNQRTGRGSNIVLHDGGDRGLGQPRIPTLEATRLLLNNHRATTTFVTVDHWNQRVG